MSEVVAAPAYRYAYLFVELLILVISVGNRSYQMWHNSCTWPSRQYCYTPQWVSCIELNVRTMLRSRYHAWSATVITEPHEPIIVITDQLSVMIRAISLPSTCHATEQVRLRANSLVVRIIFSSRSFWLASLRIHSLFLSPMHAYSVRQVPVLVNPLYPQIILKELPVGAYLTRTEDRVKLNRALITSYLKGITSAG